MSQEFSLTVNRAERNIILAALQESADRRNEIARMFRVVTEEPSPEFAEGVKNLEEVKGGIPGPEVAS